jgi:DICT domain-containing protein
MTRKNFILGGALSAAMFAGGFAIAQLPADNISAQKHPNLAAAQRFSQQAFERISAAQQANEFDMDGHAAKAKDLLQQANEQLRVAANYANRNHR